MFNQLHSKILTNIQIIGFASAMFLILLIPIRTSGQHFSKKKQYYTVEFGYTSAYFMGSDLKFGTNRLFSPGFSLGVMKKLTPRLALGINGLKTNSLTSSASITNASDQILFATFRNRNFRHGIFAMLDFYENRGTWKRRPFHNFFLRAGIDWMHMRHKIRYRKSTKKVRISNLTNDKIDWQTFVVPVGIGYRYLLSKYIDLHVEVAYNFALSNMVDLDYSKMGNNAFEANGKRDSFLNINITLNNI